MAALVIDLFTEGKDCGKPQLQEEFFCSFKFAPIAEGVLVCKKGDLFAHAAMRNSTR